MGAPNAPDFKEAVRDQWTKAAEAWGRSHDKFAQLSADVTQLICDADDLKPGQQVLDLAGGTGEPGLTVAKRIDPGGTVTCTDFVPEMVAVAEANAKKQGITNMKFQQADAENLKFGDNAFDRVVMRFGIMFPPDTARALSEIKRVLKPGQRAAFTVWQSVANNAWFGETQGILMNSGFMQPPPPGMPTPFRFAEPGSLPAELNKAGFQDVVETPRKLSWSWPGDPADYLAFVQGTFPAWVRALEAAGDQRQKIVDQLQAAVGKYYDGKSVNFGGNIFVVTASKPA